MQRVAITNSVIDAVLAQTGDGAVWDRDVPNGYVASTFPDRMDREGNLGEGKLLITPARESNNGRGQVFFDVFANLDGIEVGLSLKVSDYRGDPRPPRNSILSGSKAEHLFGLLLAARRGTVLPVCQFWQDASGQWWRVAFDAGRVLREEEVVLTDGWSELLGGDMPSIPAEEQVNRLETVMGTRPMIAPKNKGGAVAVSPLVRGGGKYVYLNMKVSHSKTGHKWVAVDAPALPASYGELLAWMGEQGDLIG